MSYINFSLDDGTTIVKYDYHIIKKYFDSKFDDQVNNNIYVIDLDDFTCVVKNKYHFKNGKNICDELISYDEATIDDITYRKNKCFLKLKSYYKLKNTNKTIAIIKHSMNNRDIYDRIYVDFDNNKEPNVLYIDTNTNNEMCKLNIIYIGNINEVDNKLLVNNFSDRENLFDCLSPFEFDSSEGYDLLQKSGLLLKHCVAQTYEQCLLAVRQNGYAIDYVINQTEEICIEAVKQNGNALQYVREKTSEI
jgi:hypothetical protein